MYQKIKGARIISPGGSSISNGGETVRAYVIERTIFDRHLLQRVAEAGADVMVKTKAVGLECQGKEGCFMNGKFLPTFFLTLPCRPSCTLQAADHGGADR